MVVGTVVKAVRFAGAPRDEEQGESKGEGPSPAGSAHGRLRVAPRTVGRRSGVGLSNGTLRFGVPVVLILTPNRYAQY